MPKRKGNQNLLDSAKNRQDEFYTQISTVEDELKNYTSYFKGKTVLCNCDDPYESAFFKYFTLNFDYLGLKKLITTCYSNSPVEGQQLSLFDVNNIDKPLTYNQPYKATITEIPDFNKDGAKDLSDISKLMKDNQNTLSLLKGNGDFRSKECEDLLKEADIVVTNPPFSLFRDYIDQLFKYKKKFLIIGRITAVTYKEILPHFLNGDVWLGKNSGHFWFKVPSYYEPKKTDFKIDQNGQKWRRMGNICWFTNLDFKARHENLLLYKHYNPADYPKYDNYDAIDVSAVKNIPKDYNGVMGVPTTFLAKWNPDQFELLGSSRYHDGSTEANDINFINGKGKFTRILIRRKHIEN